MSERVQQLITAELCSMIPKALAQWFGALDAIRAASREELAAVEGVGGIIADAVVDLPDPDSPTIAMVSPGKMSKLTSCSTSRLPDCDSNATRRSRTLSSGSRAVSLIGVPSLSGRGRL